MKLCMAILMLMALCISPTTFASDRGELLYENHCQDCHSKEVHTRDDRLVTSPELLRAWIISMTIHNRLDWSEEEIADITAYLNRIIYQFTE